MKARKKKGAPKTAIASNPKTHEIYSYSSSNAGGGGNRTKRITVKGIPGSTFTLVAQDENNKVYSFGSGGFNDVPEPLSGTIPPNGVFTTVMNVRRAKSVDIRLVADQPNSTVETMSQPTGGSKSTLTVSDAGLSDLKLEGATVTTEIISVNGNGGVDFTCSVRANDGKLINYVRAPRFNYEKSQPNDNGFVLYDGIAFTENQEAYYHNQNGVEIGSDVKIIEAVGWDKTLFTVGFEPVLAIGGQAPIPTAVEEYSTWCSPSVLVSGTLDITNMGIEDTTINVMLYNFLEVINE